MKKLNFTVVALLACFVVRAQIAAAEYFIATDPGIGNGTSIPVTGSAVDQNLNIPSTGLVEGIHKLYVRVSDNSGTWSLYDNNVFYVSSSNSNAADIASAEYFVDTDPGVGNGTTLAVTGNVIDQDFSIPTASLSNGIHKLYLRVVNTDGSWSLYDKNVFYLSPSNLNNANIASAEYFIDTDPGVGNGTALAVTGNVINTDFSIPTLGLSVGVHKLYVRLINEDGTWSLYDNNVFYLSPNNSNTALITTAEYFFDVDPGVGNGTSIDLVDAEIIDTDLTINVPTNLPAGDHFLYMRVQNTNGTWSLYAIGESVTLGTNDLDAKAVSLYPNPVKDILHINVENQSISNFKILDLTGKIVFETNDVLEKVNLGQLSSGTYLLYLTMDAGRISKKLIKE